MDGVGVEYPRPVGLNGATPSSRAAAAAAFASFIFSESGSSMYGGNLLNVPNGPERGAREG